MPNGDLTRALRSLLNSHSAENMSNTPDYILARYLLDCLDAYNRAIVSRANWYGRMNLTGLETVPPSEELAEVRPPDILPGPIDVNWS